MKLAQQTASLFLTDAGRKVLQAASVGVSGSPATSMYMETTDELGVWVRVERPDGPHLLLLRWDFVLAIDVPAGETKTVGLKV